LDRSDLFAAEQLIQEESMQGFRSLVRTFLFAWPLTFLPACHPGNEPAGPADASDGLPPCSLGSTLDDIQQKLFVSDRCKPCHHLTPSGAFPLYPTHLDLGSPGLPERMVDKMSESDPTKGKCAGRILVPKSDPLNGLFVEKVVKPTCGDRMPQAMPPLNDDQVSCVKRWAILAAQSVASSPVDSGAVDGVPSGSR
jgi:hypothetical protein